MSSGNFGRVRSHLESSHTRDVFSNVCTREIASRKFVHLSLSSVVPVSARARLRAPCAEPCTDRHTLATLLFQVRAGA
eukprot:3844141-Pleurochrysis_carterae.AAC.1